MGEPFDLEQALDEREYSFDAAAEMFEAYDEFLRTNNLTDGEEAYQLFIHGTDLKHE